MFDETRIGLDHLSFGVTDRAELDAWVTRLEAARAQYSRITTANSIPGAAVVVFRDPDNIQLEDLLRPGLGRTRLSQPSYRLSWPAQYPAPSASSEQNYAARMDEYAFLVVCRS